MLSQKQRWYARKILPFGVIWMIFGIMYSIVERGILGRSEFYPATDNPYDFTYSLLFNGPGAFFLGLCIGSLEVFYFENKLDRYALWIKILIKNFIYLTLIFTFLVGLSFFLNAVRLDLSVFDDEVMSLVGNFIKAFAFWSIMIYGAFNITVALYYSETQNSLGQKMVSNFFLGKYHRPKQENRIFMFLDMKSSTTIAEQIGHIRYFELLNDYYKTMTDPILSCNGEVYQYVGDEIIITWTEEDGLKNNNCIMCFLRIKDAFKLRSNFFKTKYGLIPKFKAGMHTGQVTTGEIGTLKKEIVYSGDVLNVAARIQGLCNEFKADILLSDHLFKQLELQNMNFEKIGNLPLKGKKETIDIIRLK